MAAKLPEDVRAFLDQPNPAVMGTVRPDGTPVTVPTWYLLEDDGTILVSLDESRRRLAYLRHEPRVSLSALDKDDWYTHISVLGRVVEITDDVDCRDADRLSVRYTGKPYPVRDRGRVSARIEIESYHGWGAKKGVRGTLS